MTTIDDSTRELLDCPPEAWPKLRQALRCLMQGKRIVKAPTYAVAERLVDNRLVAEIVAGEPRVRIVTMEDAEKLTVNRAIAAVKALAKAKNLLLLDAAIELATFAPPAESSTPAKRKKGAKR